MKKLFFLLSVISLFFNNCTTKNSKIMLGSNDSFSIKYGETIHFEDEDLEITFLEVSDSRCPKKLQCIVPGEAIITLVLKKNEISKTEEFKVKGLCFDENGECGSSLEVLNYQVKVLSLNPYPKSKIPKKSKYTFKLKLTKK